MGEKGAEASGATTDYPSGSGFVAGGQGVNQAGARAAAMDQAMNPAAGGGATRTAAMGEAMSPGPGGGGVGAAMNQGAGGASAGIYGAAAGMNAMAAGMNAGSALAAGPHTNAGGAMAGEAQALPGQLSGQGGAGGMGGMGQAMPNPGAMGGQMSDPGAALNSGAGQATGGAQSHIPAPTDGAATQSTSPKLRGAGPKSR